MVQTPLGQKIVRVVIATALVLFIARAVLPFAIKQIVNNQLQNNPDYTGRVEDIDFAVLKGRYVLRKLTLAKVSGEIKVPLFSVERMEAAVSWKNLFRGALVSEILIDRPRLDIMVEAGKKLPEPARTPWQTIVQRLFPIKIDHFKITDGEIRFRDHESTPQLDVTVNQIAVEATNLTNSKRLSDTLMAQVDGSAKIMEDGDFTLHMAINPLKKNPTFNLDSKLVQLDLTKLNAMFRHYAGIDVSSGRLSLYTEVAAEKGMFSGYATPAVDDLNVVGDKEKLSLGKAIKERAAGAFGWLFSNKEEKQSASKIPFSGKFDDPEIDIWTALGSLLRNAFVQSISPRIEGSIGFGTVPTKNRQ